MLVESAYLKTPTAISSSENTINTMVECLVVCFAMVSPCLNYILWDLFPKWKIILGREGSARVKNFQKWKQMSYRDENGQKAYKD